ncbi:MAG: alpha/beta hydrolase [Polyangiales bacterium]
MSSGLHVVRAGVGPRLLLIHGSAADHTTWSIQLARGLKERFSLIAYERRSDARSIEEHADDAVGVLGDDPDPAILVGSSFGAVVALDVLRRYGPRCAGAVMIEPPMAPTDDMPTAPAAFLAEFDRTLAADGGPAAGALFLKTVLGEQAYARIPTAFLERSTAKWAQIRADSVALLAYRPRYTELRAITTPVQLLGGERSASYFRPTLDALFAALPDARLEIIPGVGHMLHAEAHRRFAEVVTQFAADIGVLRP